MSKKKPTISVVVPAYNEEANIKAAITTIKKTLGDNFSDYEIIVLNDCSTDKTGEIADSEASKDPRVKPIHNPVNMGFGYNYKEGIRLAVMDYVIMVPGDNEIPGPAIERVLSKVGVADIVVPYTANLEVRPLSRQIVSKVFTFVMNILSGLNLSYYNGTCVLKTAAVKKIPIKTHGFAYMATILVRMIKSGSSYTEVGVDIEQREGGESKAFAIKNIISVVTALIGLFIEVRITGRKKYSSAPVKR